MSWRTGDVLSGAFSASIFSHPNLVLSDPLERAGSGIEACMQEAEQSVGRCRENLSFLLDNNERIQTAKRELIDVRQAMHLCLHKICEFLGVLGPQEGEHLSGSDWMRDNLSMLKIDEDKIDRFILRFQAFERYERLLETRIKNGQNALIYKKTVADSQKHSAGHDLSSSLSSRSWSASSSSSSESTSSETDFRLICKSPRKLDLNAFFTGLDLTISSSSG